MLMNNAEWLNRIPQHKVKIECPYCQSIEEAVVYETEPFYLYAHICSKCEYPITESEWNEVDDVE